MSMHIFQPRPEEQPALSLAELESGFHRAARPVSQFRIGAEFEKGAVWRQSGLPLPFEGPQGLQSILESLAERFNWQRIEEDGRLIALVRNGAMLSFEPGGQLELSTAPALEMRCVAKQLYTHREELLQVVDPDQVAWLALGVTPFARAEDIPLVPRARYRVMADFLGARSTTAHHMMRTTSSVQSSFDYSSEEDAATKLSVGLALSPIISALFANSPFYAGQVRGVPGFRGHIWEGMDPDRSGLLSEVVRPGEFSFGRWVQYLLDVPMMFYYLDGHFLPAQGRTFRDYLAHGLNGHFPTAMEWEVHQTSVFPEVRLKKFIEVRGADCVSPALALAFPALWKGIFYDTSSLEDARRLSLELPVQERAALFSLSWREGLAGRYRGRSLSDWAGEVLRIAADGLGRQALDSALEDERPYLEPAFERQAEGKSAGMVLQERWQGRPLSPESLLPELAW